MKLNLKLKKLKNKKLKKKNIKLLMLCGQILEELLQNIYFEKNSSSIEQTLTI